MSADDQLPNGWAWAKLSDLANYVTSGARDWSKYYSNHGVLFIRTEDINSNSLDLTKTARMSLPPGVNPVRTRVEQGDILVTVTGANVGKCAYVERPIEEAYPSQSVALVKLKDKSLAPYLQKSIIAPGYGKSQLDKMAYGLGRPVLNLDNIRDLRLPIAPTNEQRRIVAKIDELLSDLDSGVAALKRAKANLKRYRAAVLKAAVEGQLTAAWRAEHPETEPASKLLQRILTERRQKWESDQLAKFAAAGKQPPKDWKEKYVEPTPPITAGLPNLPQGWCWASIQQLAFVDVGFAFKSVEYTKEGVRLLRGENMEPGSLRWNDVRFWPEEKLAGMEHLLVEEGQIILAMDRPLVSAGLKLARAKACDLPCLLVQRMARLRMLEDCATGFLHCSMQTQAFITHLLGDQTGTQLPHISGSGIEEFVTPLPPLMEQVQITVEVAEKLSQIEAAETGVSNSLRRIVRLRQSILKQAFEGKLVPQDPIDEPADVLLKRIHPQTIAVSPKPDKRPLAKSRSRVDKQNVGRAIAYCLTRAKNAHGRTWLAKLLTLGQIHVGVPLNLRPSRYPHGPLDEIIYDAERMANKAGWFTFDEAKTAKGQTHYHVTSGTPTAATQFAELTGERKSAFDRLIDEFDRLNSDDAEIFGTVYCAWNDLLIDGRSTDDEAILAEFYAWDKLKKDFCRDRVLSRLKLMKQQGYVPIGQGPRTTPLAKEAQSRTTRNRKR